MNALEALIREMIVEEGPISVETFMTLALSHPAHGYYRTRMPFGAEGDFITAPEISQMFGELIGLWSVEAWQAMGAPKPIRLVELGPGRGTLMADAVRAARVTPGFLAALELHLVETSELLRAAQAQALAPSGIAPKWHRSADDLPRGPAIVIANEFFDCLPVRHYVRAADGWRERLIGLDEEGRLTFGLAQEPAQDLDLRGDVGETREIGLAAARLISILARRVASQGGAVLVIDYGYDRPGRGETLQAMRRHRFADPLQAPGEADLTVHVDFAVLRQAALAAGAEVHGPVAQGDWLIRLGILERASMLRRHADPNQSAAIDAALTRLTGYGSAEKDPTSMGELFKVLAVVAPGLPAPPGFSAGAA